MKAASHGAGIVVIPVMSVFCCLIAVFAVAGGFPHYLQNEIECESCHYVHGDQPSLLPDWTTYNIDPNDIDSTQYNSLCRSCHVEGGSGTSHGPSVETHSSKQAGRLGEWTIQCIVCHDPHFQVQAYTYNDYYDVGTVAAITDFTLTQSGPGWTDNELVGMIVIPNTVDDVYTSYKIISNTNTVLTVEEKMTPVPAGSSFAISYGKLIKSPIILEEILDGAGQSLKSGSKPVKFARPSGSNSFADGDASYDGICEVCHTATSYHQNSSNVDPALHYPAQNCMTCHPHSSGFIHGGGGGGTGCEECHGHDAGYEYSPGQFSQGRGTFKSHSAHTENDADDTNGPNVTCDACHDINDFPSFKDGQDLAGTTVCNPCHNDATGIATGALILKSPPTWNTTSLTCTSCHATGPAYANGSPKANSHAAHSGVGCEKCHSTTTSDGATINDPAAHPKGTYTLQSGTGVSFSYIFNAGGGTCSSISCHGNQNATWGSTLGCDSCHSYPPVPGDGKDVNDKYDGGKGAHVTSWDTSDSGGHIINPGSLNPNGDKYGDKATGYNECFKCHKNGTHADGTVDVMISGDSWSTDTINGSYDRLNGFGLSGGSPPYNGVPGEITTPKTCSNIICHQGDTPRWTCPGGE